MNLEELDTGYFVPDANTTGRAANMVMVTQR